MKATFKLTGKALLTSLLLVGGLTNITNAASGDDETYKNVTLEERLYLFDGYGSKWGLDAGSDGLWFVADRPVPETYGAALKIRNEAPNNALVIGNPDNDDDNTTVNPAAGYVGIGTDAPENKLYVTDQIDKDTQLVELMALSLENNNSAATAYSDTGFMLENRKENVRWTFRTLEEDSLVPGITNSFAISKKASGGKELIITSKDSEGGMTLVLANGAKCDRNGNWINKSTRTSKENITALSSEDAMAAFHKLEPMTYNYKGDIKESYVGFIAEDVPDLVAINSRDGLGAMDMVAVLTKVVQEQDKKIAKLEAMQKRVAQLESLLTNLALETSNKTTEKVSLNK